MQFYNFPWNKLQLDQKSWCVNLTATNDEGGQALLIDAAQCGLRPHQQDVWAIAGRFQTDTQLIREHIIIGLRRTRNSRVIGSGYQWGLDLAERRVIIAPAYHVLVRLIGNPLELHWRWSELEGERLAVLNLEAATKAEQVTEMWAQVREIHSHLTPRGGGPIPTSIHEIRTLVNEWETQKRRHPDLTLERFCANQGLDRKTFYSYRKRLARLDSK